MGGSSSQRRTDPAMSPINAFPVEELYTPQFSDSFQENNGYWHEPNPHESLVEAIAWTHEEEIALAKDWVVISENSRALMDFQAETENTFTYRHCWEILKGTLKWLTSELPKFATTSWGCSKRHKSSGPSSFNTEYGKASINLNTNVGDNDEDEENEQREAFLEIKRREVKCHERDIAAQEYRQRQKDIRFYLQPYDHVTGEQRMAMDEVRVEIKAKIICHISLRF
uniref:No apical meristem-associated C-terminal domain-containing protein n=1 Tax=Tanacetum cinerariifolium TaxID=118510 RepID=A0A6L2K2M3_TANCI|nr:hypothetical protein [Tanacetum cinerariifolium]